MTDERIKQLAFKCFWECEVKGGVSTNFPRIVTPTIIEEAIRTALSETTPTEALQKWISVDERLPETEGYVEVLASCADGHVLAADYWSEDKTFWPANGKGEYLASEYTDVTHWMPKPEAPMSPQQESKP